MFSRLENTHYLTVPSDHAFPSRNPLFPDTTTRSLWTVVHHAFNLEILGLKSPGNELCLHGQICIISFHAELSIFFCSLEEINNKVIKWAPIKFPNTMLWAAVKVLQHFITCLRSARAFSTRAFSISSLALESAFSSSNALWNVSSLVCSLDSLMRSSFISSLIQNSQLKMPVTSAETHLVYYPWQKPF